MQSPTHICPDCAPRPESKFRLLYVSFDLEALVSLRAALMRFQIQIIACSDRGSAILFLKSEIPYHLLLIDLQWQGAECFELAQLPRSLGHRKRMPTVLISATALTGGMDELARKAGSHECVGKTKDMAKAAEAITRSLEIKEIALELCG